MGSDLFLTILLSVFFSQLLYVTLISFYIDSKNFKILIFVGFSSVLLFVFAYFSFFLKFLNYFKLDVNQFFILIMFLFKGLFFVFINYYFVSLKNKLFLSKIIKIGVTLSIASFLVIFSFFLIEFEYNKIFFSIMWFIIGIFQFAVIFFLLTDKELKLKFFGLISFIVFIFNFLSVTKPNILGEKVFLDNNIETKLIYFFLTVNIFIIYFVFISIQIFKNSEKEKLKIKFDSIQDLKNLKISIQNDLHDNLGSTISSININSSIALLKLDENSKSLKPYLQNIIHTSQSVMNQINDVIWSVSMSTSSSNSLVTIVKNYFFNTFEESHFNCSYDFDEKVNLSINNPIAKKNILLITKEAINNAVKYSKGNSIIFSLHNEGTNIKLSITDNGIGIVNPVFNNGHGLNNMLMRVNELKGFMQIKNIQPNGTMVECLFPVTTISD